MSYERENSQPQNKTEARLGNLNKTAESMQALAKIE